MKLDVTSFNDYRSFLKAAFESRKQQQRNFNLARWARLLSLKSSSTLIMILNGERNPGTRLVEGFIQDLRLTQQEADHFRNLVNLEKAQSNPHLRALLLEQMPVMKSPNRQLIQMKYFRMVSQWYFLAIRELASLPNFKEDPEWIQKRLRFDVPKNEIAEALEVLLATELLQRDEEGRLVYPSSVTTTFDVPDDGIKRFHQGAFELAKEAVEKVPVAEREMLNATFTCKTDKLPAIKRRIREVLEDFGALTEGECDSVFMLQIGCFPLTEEEKKKEE